MTTKETTGTPALIEHTFRTESEARDARRTMIDSGVFVSLIDFDPAREVYAFDTLHPTPSTGGDTMTTGHFIACDTAELVAQIGRGNLGAISGGRVTHRPTGVTLPVGRGYSVTVDLAPDDTYTVSRVFTRGLKVWVKGTEAGVYCDEVGEAAYRASCFVNVPFGGHRP